MSTLADLLGVPHPFFRELRSGFHGNQYVKIGGTAFAASAAKQAADPEAQRELDEYCGPSSAYGSIQKRLRGVVDPTDTTGRWAARADERIAKVDHVFTTSAVDLPATAQLDRAVSSSFAAKLTEGSTFTDPAFTSTSHAPYGGKTASPGIKMAIARAGTDAAILRISVPAGTKVMAGAPKEKELILNRGTSFRVTGRSAAEDGREIVHLEVTS